MLVRVLFLFQIIIIVACQRADVYQPRPHQFPRLSFPDKNYERFENEECPFTVEIPSYSKAVQKDVLFNEIPAGECWFDIVIDRFDATLHCSYYNFKGDEEFGNLVNDAFEMASKHNIKASFREELLIKNQFGASGLIFKISGPVATPYQFFMTDSTEHFLRGSLYYDKNVTVDSVAPITEFLRKDIDVLLASLKWK